VTLKLQGLALIFGPTRSRVEPWVRTALSIFGARRCMFASHFPVDRLLWSWDEMLTVLEAVCDELPQGDRYEFFSGCARREYRLPA
jgi:predicted TIM-barrel fold metal-dependent hydrolase